MSEGRPPYPGGHGYTYDPNQCPSLKEAGLHWVEVIK